VILAVRVIPRSPKSAIAGMRGASLLVRLKAPPVDGAANEALIVFLAKTFGRPRRHVSLVSGEKSRDKRVALEGLSEADFNARLSEILGHASAP
jgi:uncharacterized protein (TIGR00251 family)